MKKKKGNLEAPTPVPSRRRWSVFFLLISYRARFLGTHSLCRDCTGSDSRELKNGTSSRATITRSSVQIVHMHSYLRAENATPAYRY